MIKIVVIILQLVFVGKDVIMVQEELMIHKEEFKQKKCVRDLQVNQWELEKESYNQSMI